jgi:phage gp45-like
MIALVESTAKTGVMIGTASDTATIYLDGKPGPKGKITITQGNVQVECDLDVKVTCKGKVTVDATQIEMKAKAGVTIDGGAMVTIKGGIIKLN